jgi:hypothetical protein
LQILWNQENPAAMQQSLFLETLPFQAVYFLWHSLQAAGAFTPLAELSLWQSMHSLWKASLAMGALFFAPATG